MLLYMSKENKEVNVYWAPYYDVRNPMDWSFLYPKPKTLFSLLKFDKKLHGTNNDILLFSIIFFRIL